MIKLVAIDFDDTLCMTEEACFLMENEAAKQLGFAPMTREAHLKNWGVPLEIAISERIPGIDPKKFMQQVEVIHKQFLSEKKIDVLSDNVLAFLDVIKSSGRNIAIVTSRSLQEAKHLLGDNHPLSHRVKKFYHKDSSPFHKPDPRVFDVVLSDFSVVPSETVYIGDSLGDAKSAKEAGLHFIAVLESGLRTKEDFVAYPVDYFATTLPEAMSYIETS